MFHFHFYFSVLNTSMVIVTCLYITVAFFGYLKYGDNVEGSITLNLPVEEWLAQLIILAFTLAIFFSYGLQFYVPINDILLPEIHSRVSPEKHLFAEYCLRYGLVLFTCKYALFINKRFFRSSETLQNLLYFMHKKTHVVFFVFHFVQLYIFT